MLWTAMPLAAIDKDRQPWTQEDDVRAASWCLVVHTISETLVPELFPESKLWCRVYGADTRHLLRSCQAHLPLCGPRLGRTMAGLVRDLVLRHTGPQRNGSMMTVP